MLGLPMQAYASTAMLACAFGHSAPAAEQMAALQDAHAGCHDPEPAPSSASHNCQHCAVCALASALPMSLGDRVAFGERVGHYPRPLAVTFSGFFPDGPERPPRISLA